MDYKLHRRLSLRLPRSLSRPRSRPARSTLSRASVFSPSSTSFFLLFFPCPERPADADHITPRRHHRPHRRPRARRSPPSHLTPASPCHPSISPSTAPAASEPRYPLRLHVRAMWASLRSPIGSGMGLHTRPLSRLAASWWWMRSHAASSPSPQAPFRRHCRICRTTLLACLPLFCWLYFLVADSVFPAARAWLLRARLFPTLVYGIRTALGSSPPRRTPPSCTCARRLRPPARLHPCRRASARPNTAFRPMFHLSFRGAMHFSADRNRVSPRPDDGLRAG